MSIIPGRLSVGKLLTQVSKANIAPNEKESIFKGIAEAAQTRNPELLKRTEEGFQSLLPKKKPIVQKRPTPEGFLSQSIQNMHTIQRRLDVQEKLQQLQDQKMEQMLNGDLGNVAHTRQLDAQIKFQEAVLKSLESSKPDFDFPGPLV
jgi:hypothetical protein